LETGDGKRETELRTENSLETGYRKLETAVRAVLGLRASNKQQNSNKPQATSYKQEAASSATENGELRTENSSAPATENRELRTVQPSGQCPVASFQNGSEAIARDRKLETGNGKLLLALSEVSAKPVDWVWEPYLSTGTVALLSGDPGVGKTYLALAIAAQISNRPQATSENRSSKLQVASNKSEASNKQQATSVKPEAASSATENRELRTAQPSAQGPVASFQNGPEAISEDRKLETGNRKPETGN
jgi:chromosomal replication initiation ATPase DnaA